MLIDFIDYFLGKKLGGGHGPPGPSPCYGTVIRWNILIELVDHVYREIRNKDCNLLPTPPFRETNLSPLWGRVYMDHPSRVVRCPPFHNSTVIL